ncbi:MAG: leucine-rich repeat protein, partial [Bacteroidales bacterium]|nr:leucine-rich repeat protein [Bacteroidales bacterium]
TYITASGEQGSYSVTGSRDFSRTKYNRLSSKESQISFGPIPPANNQIFYTASEEILPNWREGEYPNYTPVSYDSEFDEATGKGVLTFADELTEIPPDAFSDQTGLQQIVLPESVITIRGSAFSGCVNLASVTVGSEQTMGSNIKTIVGYAFQDCSALTDVVLPSALENLGGDAFMNCTGLTSISIPESLTLASNLNNPFWGCTGLTRFYGKYATDDGLYLLVPTGRPEDNYKALLSTALGAPELGPGKTCVLPALNIAAICTHAMGGLQCDNLVLNTNPITYINAQSISSCPNLKSIVMPETVDYIAFNALRFNPNLEYVYFTGDVLPETIPKYTELSFSIGITGTAPMISYQALSSEGWQYYIDNNRLFVYQDDDEIWLHFDNNGNLDDSFIASIDSKLLGANGNALEMTRYGSMSSSLHLNVRLATPFPDGISSSSNIYVLEYSDTIIEVAQSAFAGATTLDYISLPGLVTTIGDSAFEGCTQLKLFPTAQPGNITSIGERAFKDCEAMRYPDDDNSNLWLNGVTSLGEYAFYNCNSLKNVALGQISMVPSYSFTQCTNLERFFYDAQASISYVGLMAFGGCENLKVIMSTEDTYTDFGIVNLPDVTFVAPGAFRNCKKITDVHLGAVTSIGTEAFKTCTSLEKIEFNTQNVVAIGESSFQNCANLVQVGTTANTIDFSDATSIGMNAFNGCSSIKSVHLGALQTIEAGTFLGCTSLEGVRLSSAQNLTTIKAQAFLDCQSLLALSDQVGLTQVRINNVTTIGVQAFENSGIRAFTATSASDIGSSAFKNCTRLLSVNIPAAPILHVSLFKGDSNLTSVIAPNAITVQDDVFFGCTALSSLSLPAVQYIGNKAFAMTRGLTELKLGPNLTTLGKQIFYDESTDNTVRNWEKLHLYFAGPYPTSVVSAFDSSEPTFGYTDSQNLFMPAMVHVTPANLLGFQNNIPDDWDQYIKEHKLSADWDGSFN